MKFADVLRKEREKRGKSSAEIADALDMSEDAYAELEAGTVDEAERWAPVLAQTAIALETPTSRLVADSGRSADAADGQCGRLIRRHRERLDKPPEEVAEAAGLSAEEYAEVEAGRSPLETWAPRYLAFAEAVEQPVFNLFYPCGLPFQELDDYP